MGDCNFIKAAIFCINIIERSRRSVDNLFKYFKELQAENYQDFIN